MPAGTVEVMVTVSIAILSALLAIIGYLLADIKKTLKEDINDHENEIEGIKKEFSEFKAGLPRQYVMRDDFLRSINTLDHKIDKVTDTIGEMNKTLSKMLGIGGEKIEKG
jgi:uncharacterized protein Yka (UPF0111/DUF47 family)